MGYNNTWKPRRRARGRERRKRMRAITKDVVRAIYVIQPRRAIRFCAESESDVKRMECRAAAAGMYTGAGGSGGGCGLASNARTWRGRDEEETGDKDDDDAYDEAGREASDSEYDSQASGDTIERAKAKKKKKKSEM